MNYCIHLKKRKNKPYCNVLKEEITFSLCRECGNKEYKSKNKENSAYKNKKCTEFTKNSAKSNSNKIRNSAYSLQYSAKPLQKMKNKSNKLAKLERNRKSVFTDDLEHCYLCGNKKDDLHELLGGKNRLNCIKLGYIIPVCRLCHSRIQNDNEFKMYWAKKVQLHYEEFVGTREEFTAMFRRNWLD